jgi:hypothetical protein
VANSALQPSIFDTYRPQHRHPPAIKIISTQQFSISHASEDFKDCDVTDFQECVFAETHFVSQTNLAATIIASLRIVDDSSPSSCSVRDIVLVGHSTKNDPRILQRLGVDFYKIAPVITILDTYKMTRNLLGPGGSSNSLKDTDTAGNDAT